MSFYLYRIGKALSATALVVASAGAPLLYLIYAAV